MNTQAISSRFQTVIETVETLPPDEQLLLIGIIRQRLIQFRRAELVTQVAEARQSYADGDVQRGTLDDFLKDLKE